MDTDTIIIIISIVVIVGIVAVVVTRAARAVRKQRKTTKKIATEIDKEKIYDIRRNLGITTAAENDYFSLDVSVSGMRETRNLVLDDEAKKIFVYLSSIIDNAERAPQYFALDYDEIYDCSILVNNHAVASARISHSRPDSLKPEDVNEYLTRLSGMTMLAVSIKFTESAERLPFYLPLLTAGDVNFVNATDSAQKLFSKIYAIIGDNDRKCGGTDNTNGMTRAGATEKSGGASVVDDANNFDDTADGTRLSDSASRQNASRENAYESIDDGPENRANTGADKGSNDGPDDGPNAGSDDKPNAGSDIGANDEAKTLSDVSSTVPKNVTTGTNPGDGTNSVKEKSDKNENDLGMNL